MNDELKRRSATIQQSPTYRLAEEDAAFMESDWARASRLALEFMRADTYLRDQRIDSTVVVFGGARIKSPEVAAELLAAAESAAARPDATDADRSALQRARRDVRYTRYYDEARRFSGALAKVCLRGQGHEFVVATGGGPGLMEAANRGAFEAGMPTIGFNIRLPSEQAPNPYVTPTLAFSFHYFALRKMHFLLRARALVAFPGGFGTLDEVFESLNLVQTRKIRRIPIVLVGAEHWRRVVDFQYLVDEGFIDEADRDLLQLVDDGESAARIVQRFHGIEA